MLFDYHFRNYNFRLLFYVLCLTVVGILAVGSASGQASSAVTKQIAGVVVSLLVCLGLSLIDYHQYFRFTTIIYVGCIGLLAAVLLMGKSTKGATRWLKLGPVQIQPSEFVKIGLILVLSWFLARNQERMNKPSVVASAAGICLLPLAMVYLQPNLSTTIVITFTLACIIYAAGLSYKWILGGFIVGLPSAALCLYLALLDLIPFLKKYQAQRILAKFFHGDSSYADLNRQQDNSIMAIGSGQLRGKGLFNNTLSSVKNGNFLSEEQTDFIFAVIGEEMGFIGCVAVIILYALVVYECIWIASRAKDTAGRLICTGVASLLAFQSFANIAVATGIFPNTGLPLPFISSGLSSLLSMYIGIGIVLNIGLQRKSTNH
ncbi:MAG: rod shape-determining protein RodA [Clostridium sp.]|nr:rod shape-determining protein RodA [Clostridium sp.]